MCQEPDDFPPDAPVQGLLDRVERLTLQATDGTVLAATLARTREPDAAGVVVVPDVRGLHPFYERLAEQFAQAGVHALAIDQYGRSAGADYRGADFDYGPLVAGAAGTVADDIVVAVARLRELGARTVFVTGFCFGGRAALMAAAGEGVDGAIGFYGWPVSPGADGVSPESLARDGALRAPVLAIFGEADAGIPPHDVERYAKALQASGVPHDVRVYADAPHGFFDRKRTEHDEHCADAWGRVLAFIECRPTG